MALSVGWADPMGLLDLPPSQFRVAQAIISRAAEHRQELVNGVVKALLSPWRKS